MSLEDACSLLGGTGHPRWIEVQRDGQTEQNRAREGEKKRKKRSVCRRTSQRTKEETAGEQAEIRRHQDIKRAEK